MAAAFPALLAVVLLVGSTSAQMHPTDPFDTDACPWDAVQARAGEVDEACCSTPDAGCPLGGGFPALCPAECAVVFVPFDDECRTMMSQLMPDLVPSLNSLADRCLTTTGEGLFQMVRELEEAECCVDTDAIVSGGEVMGEVESLREWQLVFRQDTQAGGFFPRRYPGSSPPTEPSALRFNPTDPENPLFSVLDRVEDYRDSDGLLTFKMVWPELSPVNSNSWAQETNPFIDDASITEVAGYLPLRLHFSGDYGTNQLWEGLLTAPDSLAEADFGAGHWGQLGALHEEQSGFSMYRLDVSSDNGAGHWCLEELSFYNEEGRISTPESGASAQTEYSAGYAASIAFNELSSDDASYYCSADFAPSGYGWLQYTFPSPVALTSYAIEGLNGYHNGQVSSHTHPTLSDANCIHMARLTGGGCTGQGFDPRDWTFLGSNDGETWMLLDTQVRRQRPPRYRRAHTDQFTHWPIHRLPAAGSLASRTGMTAPRHRPSNPSSAQPQGVSAGRSATRPPIATVRSSRAAAQVCIYTLLPARYTAHVYSIHYKEVVEPHLPV